MQVHEIMTKNPVCCSSAATLRDAAILMADCDCGEIPVLDGQGRLLGVVTDRDICCRGLAQGLDAQASVQEVMSSPVLTVAETDSIESCCELMDENQIRRVPVVDESGACCGIVAQADIAREMDDSEIGPIVRDISQPTAGASRVSF